jgi:hypothetical protein
LQVVECRLGGLEEGESSSTIKENGVAGLTCSPRVELEVAAVEGISFPVGKEEGTGTSFDEARASDVVGVDLLELVFAFFEGGSAKPSALQTSG